MRNQVQLIAYADRFGGQGVRDVHAILREHLPGVFGGVHLLPFFYRVDGADAGFDPIDHTVVDPRVGDWDQLRDLSRDHEVMADLIVNHMSSEAPQFRDYLARGAASRYDGLFLTREDVFPNGASPEDLARIYRPRPGLPFTPIALADGTRREFWTTFTPQQLDLDVEHPEGRYYLRSILERFAASGIRLVRLDAVGYAIKRPGTSCFMLPETFAFIEWLTAEARRLGIEVLVEVHSHYSEQVEIARHVDWVYDFALPPLVLHAFTFGTAAPLARWIGLRPRNALTVLDTHDGIGIIDIGADARDPAGRPGLVPPQELARLVDVIHENSRGESRLATGAAASNLDLYQVNCTFFDALGRSEHLYLLARALQFFLPGVPQVYYVGLLAGANDLELLARTGVGRDINRHRYGAAEVLEALERPVVHRLIELIRIRNEHPAFGGAFSSAVGPGGELRLSWVKGEHRATLAVDFQAGSGELALAGPGYDAGPGRPATRRFAP